MSALSTEQIVALFEEDARARKRLAELIVAKPEVELAIVSAVLGELPRGRSSKPSEER